MAKKLDIKIGKSAGQKAADAEDKRYRDSGEDIVGYGEQDYADHNADLAAHDNNKKSYRKTANKKASTKLTKDAKAGKAKAEKALGRKIKSPGLGKLPSLITEMRKPKKK